MDVRSTADKEIQSDPSSFTYNPSSFSLKQGTRTKDHKSSIIGEVKNNIFTSTLDLPHLHKHNLNSNSNYHSRDLGPDPIKPNPVMRPSPSPTPSPRVVMIRYRECQRNHAAHLGSHVVDGCGEFMPAGEEGTPLALRCAACDCHRNFHRREAEGETGTGTGTVTTPLLQAPPLHHNTSTTRTSCYISFNKPQKIAPVVKPNPIQHCSTPVFQRAPVMMTFGGAVGAAAESSSDDLNAYRGIDMGGQMIDQYGGSSKKRFRTKFTQEQKDKMMEFAEKLEWKMQKQDDVQVQQFCNELGIKRQVFKVWMHNNKQAMKRKQP